MLTQPIIPDALLKAVIDFFSPEQLVEYLGITSEDLVTDYPDLLEEHLEDLTFLMEYHGW